MDRFMEITEEMERNGNGNIPKIPSKNKTYNAARKFKNEWTQKCNWLDKDKKSEKAYCKACNKFITCALTHIERHEKTTSHQIQIKRAYNTPTLKNYLTDDEKDTQMVKSAELKLNMFLHEHNLPFNLMDHLPNLLRSVCPDSRIACKINCGRIKATAITKEYIAKEHLEQVAKMLQENVFLLIVDETTDINTEKSLALVARSFDGLEWNDRFIGLLKLRTCSADSLFDAICSYLKEINVPITNLIGLAADNASVMMGNIKGLQARFKEILPNIFILGCVCHSFNLCASAAVKKLPRSLEDFIRAIYNYFAHSQKRSEKLIEFQKFVDLKPKKLLHPSQTRWLSLQAAVNRVLENWSALILYFTDECFNDNLHSTQHILYSLKNPIFQLYFTFLSYILEIVNNLNLEFQSSKPKLRLLLPRLKDMFRLILRNYMKKTYLDNKEIFAVDPRNTSYFLNIENIYFGVKTELLLIDSSLNPNEVHNFRINVLEFYIELCHQIQTRFDFSDPVLNFISNVCPKNVLSGTIINIATRSYQLFPHLVQIDDLESLNTEWRLLSEFSDLKQYEHYSIQDFWTTIFGIKNGIDELMFPTLKKLVIGLLSLPHSSAAAERIFSQLNHLKTKTRNRLHIDTVDSILHAKQLLKNNTCYNWQPKISLLNRKLHYNENIRI